MDHTEEGNKGNKEDSELWRHATRDVEPLESKKSVQKKQDRPYRKKQITPRQAAPLATASSKVQETIASKGVDRRTDDKLRKGKMPIEGTLDLHGFSQEKAHITLIDFIEKAVAQDKRCVLIITGKGRTKIPEDQQEYGIQPQPGILRRRVPEWLEDARLLPLILRYYPAKPYHGGEGALYVLLRRNRNYS